MVLEIPPELKPITPYVRRAEELDKDKSRPESRLVAFYCRQFAVHTGIPLSTTSAAAKTCLTGLLESLETEKVAMDNFTREEAGYICRQFANQVFDKADGEDRMGMANKGTAKTFYTAATFLQILAQFKDGDEETEESSEDRKKELYAKWKATDILKAIKEGRTPKPGGYGEDEEEEENAPADEEAAGDEKKVEDKPVVETVDDEEENAPHDEVEAGSSIPPPIDADASFPAAPTTELPLPPPVEAPEEEEGVEVELPPPPAYPGNLMQDTKRNRPPVTFDLPDVDPAPLPPPPKALPKPVDPPKKSGGFFGMGGRKKKPTKQDIADATELTKFALAALDDKDTELALERLRQAIQSLESS